MKKFLLMILFVLLTAVVMAAPPKVYNVDYWVINAKGGVTYPIGEFANHVTPGYNFGISARKGFDMEFSAGGGFNFISVPYKSETAPDNFSASVIDAELAWAPYLPDFFIWPYLKAGIGMYIMKYAKQTDMTTVEMTSETSFGLLFGLGANYPITKMFAANLEVLYNHVSLAGGTGDLNTFLTIDLGVTIFLK
ncbi:MAG: porin family protein [Candidatus Goldbacteria bacterium]|nr:porin family protein [Candidatus Goldiibacteriota bacterium]